MELRFEIISLDTMTILIYRQRSIISNPIFFHLFFRSTKVFNANLCHFASRSPRFPIILRLTYGTRLRTNRLRHVSLFSSHRKKKRSSAYSNTSFLFRSIHPFFLFSPFFHFLFIYIVYNFYDLTSCAYCCVDPRTSVQAIFFFELIGKKKSYFKSMDIL